MNKQKWLYLFLIALIILGVIFRILLLNHQYSSEETDFVKAAEGIKNTGVPVYYFAEQDPKDFFLVHPPMYIYLASLFLIISPNEVGMKAVNFVFALLTIFILILFCYRIFGKRKIGRAHV
jgi:4-amino-4-deoxy-L-arabinose transferase-like glycosyltransferase